MSSQIWGDYEIHFDQVLGRGGMGTVYRGRQISLGRPVAIKLLRRDLTEGEDFIRRFRREAELLARLIDNHIVQVFGAGEANGDHFYAMEYVEGEDLSALIRSGKKFTVGEILHIAEHVATAFKAAWKFQIVHRDIKPSNIVITKDGTVKVMDFGLAKNPETDLTQSSIIMGTAKYVSPEQATGGSCDIRSDLYSLGVVLYELATGTPPFSGDSPTSVMYQHVHENPVAPRERNPSLTPELEKVILRCLAKKPEVRFQTPDELLSDVRALQEGITVGERTLLMTETLATMPVGKLPVPSETPAPLRRNRKWLGISLTAASLVLGAGLYFAYRELTKHRPDSEGSSVAGTNGGTSTAISDPGPGLPPVVYDPPREEDPAKKHLENANRHFEQQEWKSAEEEYALALAAMEEDDARRERTLLRAGEAGKKREEEERRHGEERRREEIRSRLRELIQSRDFLNAKDFAKEHFGETSGEYVQTERLYRMERYDKEFELANRYENEGNWEEAAGAYGRAFEFAGSEDPGLKDRLRNARDFCRDMVDAWTASLSDRRDWDRALLIYRRHEASPRGHRDYIAAQIRRVEEEAAKDRVKEGEHLREEMNRLREEARRHRDRAAWGEGHAAVLKAEKLAVQLGSGPDEELKALASELGVAVRAPEGFVFVPGGRYSVGADDLRPADGPHHEASVSAFYISVGEVTRGQYAKFLASMKAEPHKTCPTDEPVGKDHAPLDWMEEPAEAPVTGVDWHDAVAYAKAQGPGFRLPSEAEWEVAAAYDLARKASRRYSWGDRYEDRKEDVSFFGARGMGGGVFDWVADEFVSYPGAKEEIQSGKEYRVLRGGILLQEQAEQNARTAFRHWKKPASRDSRFGFRLVKEIE